MINKSNSKAPKFTLIERLRLLSMGIPCINIPTDTTAQELIKLAKLAKATCGGIIVEIGSYLGASSIVMAKANRHGVIYCIDTWQNDAMSEGSWDTMSTFFHNTRHCKNIVPIRMWSTEAADKTPQEVDMIFIDGDHSYEGVKKDIDLYFPKIKSGGIIAMHDIGWAEGVNRVIKEDIMPNISENETLPNLFWGRKK